MGGGTHVYSSRTALLLLASLKACDWSENVFGGGASPRLLNTQRATSPFCTVHGDQCDTNFMALELLWLTNVWVLVLNQVKFFLSLSCSSSSLEPLPPLRCALRFSRHLFVCVMVSDHALRNIHFFVLLLIVFPRSNM